MERIEDFKTYVQLNECSFRLPGCTPVEDDADMDNQNNISVIAVHDLNSTIGKLSITIYSDETFLIKFEEVSDKRLPYSDAGNIDNENLRFWAEEICARYPVA
jgi:hypothetical protein